MPERKPAHLDELNPTNRTHGSLNFVYLHCPPTFASMLPYDQILSQLRQQSLFRELRTIEEIQGPVVEVGDRCLVNFASNDYLGLSQHPSVKAAAKTAIDRYGVGSGASRLVTGSQSPHAKFEKEIAAFKGTESALLFSTGYAAAIGTICSLVGPGDVIILDKLCHACLIDGAKLSGAPYAYSRTIT